MVVTLLSNAREPRWWGSRIASLIVHVAVAASTMVPPGGCCGGTPPIEELKEVTWVVVPVADGKKGRGPGDEPRPAVPTVPDKLAGMQLGYTEASTGHLMSLIRRFPETRVGFRTQGDFGAMCPAVALYPVRIAGGCVSAEDGYPVEVAASAIPELSEAQRLAAPHMSDAVAVVVLPPVFGNQVREAILAKAGSLTKVGTVVLELAEGLPGGFRVKLVSAP